MTKFKPIEKDLSLLSESASKIMTERYFNEEDIKKFTEFNDDDEDYDDDDEMIIERFQQIQSEIIDLAGEALDIIPEHLKNRARSYWYGQILSAAGDSEYAGGSMHSMEDTLEELNESTED